MNFLILGTLAFMGHQSSGGTQMTRLSRIESLKSRHFRIDQKIMSEGGRPRPDERVLMCLKLQKLRIKEEIERLSA
ncbi:hypothetical protein AA18889_2090 [Acetobacter senegalensis DSM 18889]|nr:hypothetical protein DB34_09235 [Acetobacter pasteurianus]GBR59387.1 hypothetical protein AA18889_2090 [Acetobacter senegalensis DSM 18889]